MDSGVGLPIGPSGWIGYALKYIGPPAYPFILFGATWVYVIQPDREADRVERAAMAVRSAVAIENSVKAAIILDQVVGRLERFEMSRSGGASGGGSGGGSAGGKP